MTPPPHAFISNSPDVGGDRLSVGYPDECLDFTSFAGSLGALVTDGEWLIQPFSQKKLAIVVDFISDTQAQAEASLGQGWNGAWEFPIGCANTVHSRIETNEQNARIERHLALIVTGETMREFFWGVTERLLDVHSCNDVACRVCGTRFPRDLSMVLMLLAGLHLSTIYLFSKWQPSSELRGVLRAEHIEIQWNPLQAIPIADLEANRCYSIWDGTKSQYDDFISHFWAPSWRTSTALATDKVKASSTKNARGNNLTIYLPMPDTKWRSLNSMHFVGTYAMRDDAFSNAQTAAFVQEANRICLLLVRQIRKITNDPSDFTWLLKPEDLASLATSLGLDPGRTAWAATVRAVFDPNDNVSKSLWDAWAPRLNAALHFAIPAEDSQIYDILDGTPDNFVTYEHDE